MKEPSRTGIQVFECMRAFELLDDVCEQAPAGCHFDHHAWLGVALRYALTNQGAITETSVTWGVDRGDRSWYQSVLSDAQLRVIEILRECFDQVGKDDPRNILLVTDYHFRFNTQTIAVRYVRR